MILGRIENEWENTSGTNAATTDKIRRRCVFLWRKFN